MSSDIYANRLNSVGNVLWEGEPVTITNSNDSKSDMMTGKGENFLIISWSENGFVYAHCLREDGTLGTPEIGSSNCTAGDGTEGVELWDVCYSIENTTELNLYISNLTGSIPPEIGYLTNLTDLILHNNQLTGSIPPEIGNLTNLGWLYLQGNQLTGSIPPEIGNLTNLERLKLYDNQLTGEIPESLCDLNIDWSNTNDFSITVNQLCPPYPSCIEDYVGEQDTSDCD